MIDDWGAPPEPQTSPFRGRIASVLYDPNGDPDAIVLELRGEKPFRDFESADFPNSYRTFVRVAEDSPAFGVASGLDDPEIAVDVIDTYVAGERRGWSKIVGVRGNRVTREAVSWP